MRTMAFLLLGPLLLGGCLVQRSLDRPDQSLARACHKPIAGPNARADAGGYPVWSPDGRWIVFTSHTEDENVDLYLIRPDGTGLARLTDNPATDAHPNWAPDSQWIVFDSTRDGNREGYLVSRDGCAEQRVVSHPGTDITFAWHPRGREIVFNSDRGGADHIYRASISRSREGVWTAGEPVQITSRGSRNGAVTWNPSGKSLLLETRRDGNRELHTVQADGTNDRNISNSPTQDNFGRWAPDGKRIAFWSDRTGNDELFMMNEDGSGVRQLTTEPAKDQMPSWAPDGRSLVFVSERTGRRELFILNLANLSVRQLTCGGLSPCK